MKNLDEIKYLKEIENYYLNLKGSFSLITPKEAQIIIGWYKKNINIDLVKKFIKEEIVKIPKNKRKKFSLIPVDKKLKEKIKNKTEIEKGKKSKWEIIINKLNLPEDLLKIPENFKGDKSLFLEKNVISYIWKNMPKEEKEKLIKESLSEIENEIIFNSDKKSVIKSIIYTKIKEDLLNRKWEG